MHANDPNRTLDSPGASPHRPAEVTPQTSPICSFHATSAPWLLSIARHIRELAELKKRPPLQISSRPLSEDELRGAIHINELERTSLPWYRTILGGVRELLLPPRLPPLELTSTPVQVREMLQRDPYMGGSLAISTLLQCGLVALALLIGTNKAIQKKIAHSVLLMPADVSLYASDIEPNHGGGGGGDRSPLPASQGHPVRAARTQFTPPVAVPNNDQSRLMMEPTIIADQQPPTNNLPMIGDPFSRFKAVSNGPGNGTGIGSGGRGGIGSGDGPGLGPGSNGGISAYVYTPGGGVTMPVAIFKPEPEYSEEARAAKFQGTVRLAIVVDTDGTAKDIRVVGVLGMGLDEKAVEAVRKWRFKPGRKGAQPVPVSANVEVHFRLL